MMKFKTCLAFAALAAFTALASAAGAQTTMENLNRAYQAESNAVHRYQKFAQTADAENLPQTAKLFRAAAASEEIHRKRIERSIQKLSGRIETFKLDEISLGTTAENLRQSIDRETAESATTYPGFLATATADNLKPATRAFDYISESDKQLAAHFQQALDTLSNETSATYYVCGDCGLVVTQLPEKKCPVCRKGLKEFKIVN